MARTALNTTGIPEQMNPATGKVPTTTAGDSVNHHSFINAAGDVFIRCNNAGGSTCNITILTPATVSSQLLTVQDPVVAVLTATNAYIGPFPTAIYNQSDGSVYFDIDFDTSVTFECVQHGPTS